MMQGHKVGSATIRLLECCHPWRGAAWLGMTAARVAAPCGFPAYVGLPRRPASSLRHRDASKGRRPLPTIRFPQMSNRPLAAHSAVERVTAGQNRTQLFLCRRRSTRGEYSYDLGRTAGAILEVESTAIGLARPARRRVQSRRPSRANAGKQSRPGRLGCNRRRRAHFDCSSRSCNNIRIETGELVETKAHPLLGGPPLPMFTSVKPKIYRVARQYDLILTLRQISLGRELFKKAAVVKATFSPMRLRGVRPQRSIS
jgi:hypothetical protein